MFKARMHINEIGIHNANNQRNQHVQQIRSWAGVHNRDSQLKCPRSYLKPFLDEIWCAQNLRCVFNRRKQPLSYTGKNVGVTLRI